MYPLSFVEFSLFHCFDHFLAICIVYIIEVYFKIAYGMCNILHLVLYVPNFHQGLFVNLYMYIYRSLICVHFLNQYYQLLDIDLYVVETTLIVDW